MIRQLLSCLSGLLSAATLFLSTAEADVTLRVSPQGDASGLVEVEFVLPESLRSASHLLLVAGDVAIPAQWINQSQGLAASLVQAKSAEYQVRGLATLPEKWAENVVRIEQSEQALKLLIRDLPVLQYNIAVRQPPEGIDPVYARSGHIHPLFTPTGEELTSEFPADHAHQHAVFHAWVNTTFSGRKTDFWNQAGRTGHIEHVAVHEVSSGPVFGQFQVELRHSALNADGTVTPVLKELLTVRAWKQPERFVVDLETRQICVADSPLTINEYHYGGMAIRGRDNWLQNPESDFLTSEGNNRTNGNHTRPDWVAMFGPADGTPIHVAILDHPGNFRFPQPVRLHPSKPYFVFTPPQLGSFEIKPGEEYAARYRYLLADGAPQKEQLNQDFTSYAKPAVTEIIE